MVDPIGGLDKMGVIITKAIAVPPDAMIDKRMHIILVLTTRYEYPK